MTQLPPSKRFSLCSTREKRSHTLSLQHARHGTFVVNETLPRGWHSSVRCHDNLFFLAFFFDFFFPYVATNKMVGQLMMTWITTQSINESVTELVNYGINRSLNRSVSRKTPEVTR